jgi:hypothetical protein
MIAGVFHADSNPEVSALCEEIRQVSSDYVQSTQDRIWKAETAVAAPTAETPAPAVVAEAPPGDDLPF